MAYNRAESFFRSW